MKKEERLVELINKLKTRNNNSYKFFEELLIQFKHESTSVDARKKLLSSFAITQYAGFTIEEENLLSEFIEANMTLGI